MEQGNKGAVAQWKKAVKALAALKAIFRI